MGKDFVYGKGKAMSGRGDHNNSLAAKQAANPDPVIGRLWYDNEIAYKQERRLMESWARVGFISVPSKELRDYVEEDQTKLSSEDL